MKNYDFTNYTNEELAYITKLFWGLRCEETECDACIYRHICTEFLHMGRAASEELDRRVQGE